MTTDWACKFPERTVKITYPTGWMRVHLHKFFPDGTKGGAEKFYKILRKFQREGMNAYAVEDLRDWLNQAVAVAAAAWMQASQDYVNGWRLTDGLSRRSEKYKKIKAENDRLTMNVKKAKKLSVRMQDRKKLFEDYFGNV